MLNSSSGLECPRTVTIINRLIPYLSSTDRSTILNTHPIENFPELWAAINWRYFSDEQQGSFHRYLASSLTGSSIPKVAILFRLFSFCNLDNKRIFIKELNNVLPNFIKVTHCLVAALNHKQAKEYRKHIEFLLALLFPVLLYVANPAEKELHLQLMQILKLVIEAKILPSVQLNAVKFLSSVGPPGVASSPQQAAILRVFSNIFCEFNASRSYILQQYSLRTLELFLKTTPHGTPQMASSCVKDGDKNLMTDFINRTATKVPDGELNGFWNSQLEFITKSQIVRNQLPKLHKEDESEPGLTGSMAKRPRLEHENEDYLQLLLSNLEQAVTSISQLAPLPAWAKDEICERRNLLSSLL